MTTSPPPEPPVVPMPLRRAFAYMGASVGCILRALALNVVGIRSFEVMHRGGNVTAASLVRIGRWVVLGTFMGALVCG